MSSAHRTCGLLLDRPGVVRCSAWCDPPPRRLVLPSSATIWHRSRGSSATTQARPLTRHASPPRSRSNLITLPTSVATSAFSSARRTARSFLLIMVPSSSRMLACPWRKSPNCRSTWSNRWFHLVESLVHLVESLVHLVESLVHLVESLVHLVESLVHLAELPVHLVESLVHLVGPLVHLVEIAGPLGRIAGPLGRTAGPLGRIAGPLGRTAGPLGRTAGPLGRIAGPCPGAGHRSCPSTRRCQPWWPVLPRLPSLVPPISSYSGPPMVVNRPNWPEL